MRFQIHLRDFSKDPPEQFIRKRPLIERPHKPLDIISVL